jgi:hypothetical protein
LAKASWKCISRSGYLKATVLGNAFFAIVGLRQSSPENAFSETVRNPPHRWYRISFENHT